jgi:ribosomal protein S18 acetylase RimI-like enzyme
MDVFRNKLETIGVGSEAANQVLGGIQIRPLRQIPDNLDVSKLRFLGDGVYSAGDPHPLARITNSAGEAISLHNITGKLDLQASLTQQPSQGRQFPQTPADVQFALSKTADRGSPVLDYEQRNSSADRGPLLIPEQVEELNPVIVRSHGQRRAPQPGTKSFLSTGRTSGEDVDNWIANGGTSPASSNPFDLSSGTSQTPSGLVTLDRVVEDIKPIARASDSRVVFLEACYANRNGSARALANESGMPVITWEDGKTSITAAYPTGTPSRVQEIAQGGRNYAVCLPGADKPIVTDNLASVRELDKYRTAPSTQRTTYQSNMNESFGAPQIRKFSNQLPGLIDGAVAAADNASPVVKQRLGDLQSALEQIGFGGELQPLIGGDRQRIQATMKEALEATRGLRQVVQMPDPNNPFSNATPGASDIDLLIRTVERLEKNALGLKPVNDAAVKEIVNQIRAPERLAKLVEALGEQNTATLLETYERNKARPLNDYQAMTMTYLQATEKLGISPPPTLEQMNQIAAVGNARIAARSKSPVPGEASPAESSGPSPQSDGQGNIYFTAPNGNFMGGGDYSIEGTVATVGQIWIRAEYQSQGLGTRVLSGIEAEARQRGATQVVLEAAATDPSRQKELEQWYNRQGYSYDRARIAASPGQIYMKKEL